ARFILPGLEMHDLRSADAEDNLERFRASSLLRHRRVEARATSLDESKVKPGRERDPLHVIARIIGIVAAEVAVVARNGRVQASGQAGDGGGERCPELRL